MFGKHFESMYTGSMVGSGAVVFAVWGYVISHQKPPSFIVELNSKLLAFILGEEEDNVKKAIEHLCSPDTKSRSREFEGRKLLQEGEYSYRVVNGAHYHNIRNNEERRAYWRDQKNKKAIVTYSQDSRDVLAYLNKVSRREYRAMNSSLAPIDARLKEEGVTVEGCKLMIDRQVARWKGTHMEEYLRPSTLFGKEKFNEYYAAKDSPVVHPTGNGGNSHVDRGAGTTNEGTAAEYRGMGKVVGTPNIPGLSTGDPG
jgi:uncharacterized phage protein (TIGR02220 family)